MGYGDRDELPVSNEPTASVILISLVRGLGLMLLLAGLVTAAFILMEAWALYKYPERIEVLALAVEKGSNIDKALLPKKLSGENGSRAGQDGDSASVSSESTNVRLSYFFAWFIAFFLILLIARIAMSAITTGGKLALYDTEVKKLARALLEESGKKTR